MRFLLLISVFLAGCTAQAIAPEGDRTMSAKDVAAGCCEQLETFPQWMVDAGEAIPGLAPWMGTVNFRQGHLSQRPDAWSLVTPALRPLDILLFHSDGRLSSRLIPGHFSHGAVYLGTEQQLRHAGLWDTAWMAPHHAAIRDGKVMLDSVTGGVRLATLSQLADTDAVGVVRPRLSSKVRRTQVYRDLVSALGTPFDFQFDSGDSNRLFCIELIARAMPELNLPEVNAYGRKTIVPDAVAALSFESNRRLSYVGYLRAGPREWRTGPPLLMAQDMRAAWPE